MKNFAVILSGSGVFDGSEIHEATLSMYQIKKQGANYEVFAPDIDQYHVINHITGQPMEEKRNVLIESARIARGKIKPLSEFNAEIFDAILFPGGFGAAKNLSTFAFDGPDCEINEDVKNAVISMHASGKPIGALCISPVIISKILGKVELTIGDDKDTAKAVEKMGSKHRKTDHAEVVIDATNNIFTTPCYMLDANILQIDEGVENVIRTMLKSINE